MKRIFLKNRASSKNTEYRRQNTEDEADYWYVRKSSYAELRTQNAEREKISNFFLFTL
jgi:hypothetical protein